MQFLNYVSQIKHFMSKKNHNYEFIIHKKIKERQKIEQLR